MYHSPQALAPNYSATPDLRKTRGRPLCFPQCARGETEPWYRPELKKPADQRGSFRSQRQPKPGQAVRVHLKTRVSRGLKEAGYVTDAAGAQPAGNTFSLTFDGFDFSCRVTRTRLRICRIQPSNSA